MADRYGRRLPLMVDLVFYSVVEVATGFAPNLTAFLVLRALFGIGMGGEWGVGRVAGRWRRCRRTGAACSPASCRRATRSATCSRRWLLLRASRAWAGGRCSSSAACPRCWRCSCARRSRNPRSGRTQHGRDWAQLRPRVASHWPLFLYLIVLMAMMNFISHGTQDMYPTFLQARLELHAAATRAWSSSIDGRRDRRHGCSACSPTASAGGAMMSVALCWRPGRSRSGPVRRRHAAARRSARSSCSSWCKARGG